MIESLGAKPSLRICKICLYLIKIHVFPPQTLIVLEQPTRSTRGRGPIALDEAGNSPSSTSLAEGATHSTMTTPILDRPGKTVEGGNWDDGSDSQALGRQSGDKAFVTQK